jgi:DNA-binding GntR family transcriptional regulator
LRGSEVGTGTLPRRGGQIGSGPAGEGSLGARYTPLAELVTEQLRAAIFEGQLAPGAPIRQETVARELGTSRIPVREALRQLEVEGLVTIVPHSGARVATLDFDECLEIYRIRERVEPLAFGESVGHLSPAQLETIDQLCNEIEGRRGSTAWIDVDRRFHLACYDGAPPRLRRMIVGFWHATQQYRRILQQTLSEQDYDAYHHEHRLMVNSLVTENVSAGESLVRIHIERSRTLLSDHCELFDR